MSKHTDGPWKYTHGAHCPGYGFVIQMDDACENEVASVYEESTSLEQAEADARLIAAAPELLDLALAVDATVTKYEQEGRLTKRIADLGVLAQAAIAKAKGA